MQRPSSRPSISIGLAVRNGADVIERCLTSILEQDFSDFEIVVSDNASDDGTSEIVSRFAETDDRIRASRNATNIGLQPNMNRAFDLSRGTYFRWISSDDWLEPKCLSTCVQALEANPAAIGVTTYFRIHTIDGATRYEEFRGEFPDSHDSVRRLKRMLWFFHAGDALYDPMYGLYRRSALARTPRLRRSEQADWLLVSELALLGPIVNVPRCLSHRTRTYGVVLDRDRFLRRLHPEAPEAAKSSARRLHHDLVEIVRGSDLSPDEAEACIAAVRRFALAETTRRGRERIRRAGGSILRKLGLRQAPN